MKRPAFQFYPGDWQHDSALKSCSISARGLWIEMMCVMHQSQPYGYLLINGKHIDEGQLARVIGATVRDVSKWMKELESAGVYSKDETGIFSRRMVRDERLRRIRAEAGSLGGNPNLLGGKVNQKTTTKDKQVPTPSSSSSSSSSSSTTKPKAEARAARGARLPKEWQLPKPWGEWAMKEQPTWDIEHTRKVGVMFRNYWVAKSGKDASKLDWEGTWQNWVMKEGPKPGERGAGSGAPAPKPKQCPGCGGSVAGGTTHMAIGDVCNRCYGDYMAGTWDGKAPRPKPPAKELL